MPPVPVIPHTATKVELTPRQKLLVDIQNILKEYDGLEANIPINHIYWQKMNQFRGMK